MTAERRTHLYIAGRVHGVGFRYSALDRARRLGLLGWVRNTPDGRVECVVEGPAEAVDAYVAWCRRGPSMAHVTTVEHMPEAPTGELTAFEIRG